MADIPVSPQPGPQPTPQPTDNPKLPGQDSTTEMPKESAKEDIDESESTGGSALEQEAGELAAGRP